MAAEESRSFDWAAIEGDLGVRLPADYKLLAESFPAGWSRGWVRLRLPERTGDDRPRLLSDFAAGEMEALREFRETAKCVFPFPLFPEPGGVLPWGYLRSPGVAYWLTGPGDPDEWPVVIMPNANLASSGHEDGLSFSGLLRQHARREFGQLPLRDSAAGPVTFTPYRPAI